MTNLLERFRAIRTLASTICLSSVIGTILTANLAIAKDDPNPVFQLDTLRQNIASECKSEFARQLALISIHANDQLLEDNLEFANFCGNEMVKQYELLTQSNDQTQSIIIDGIGPTEGLINFESPHVHPIDVTPNGSRLLAVNTAAHRLEVFQINGSDLNLVASIPVGIDPVSVRARNNEEAWVVNHISDSVSVINLDQQTVTHTLKTDNEPADVVFAGSPLRAFVSASEANRINVFNLSNLEAAPAELVLDGEDPRALAVSEDGQTVCAAIFESGNNTGIVANSGFSGGGTIVRGVGLDDNDVAIIDAGDLNVSYRRSLMNINMAMAVHPSTGDVHVVGTEALNEIETEPALNGLFLRINTASFSGSGSSGANIVDLNPHLNYQSPSVSASLRQQSIGDPRGIAWRNNGQRAFVTGMGSNNVVVIDAAGGRVSQFAVGQGPTGIVLQDSSDLGYVMNKFDGSISVIDLEQFSEIRQVEFDDPTGADVKNGRPFLYDTHLTSGTGHLSCASCHVDARTDRLGWQLSNQSAGSEVVPRASNSLPGAVIGSVTLDGNKDPMTTQTLIDIMDHPRFHWRGDRETIDDFNGTFVNLMGRSTVLSQSEMDAFKEFLGTTWLPPNPYRTIDNQRPQTVTLPDGSTATSTLIGPNTTDALRGGANGNNCLICHSGQGNATRNFGANNEIGEFIIAPALPALYDKMGSTFGRSGFGFFHNGAADLFEASRTRQFLAEILTLEGPEGPLVGDEIRQAPHAGMGQQLTVNGALSSAENSLLNQFITIANNSEWIELIAHARVNNLQRGYKLSGGNNFDADITGETTTRSELIATALDQPVTFTLVGAGMGTRFALDFDLDGELNNDQSANTAPSLAIQSPVDGGVFSVSTTFSLTAIAEDSEDGDLTDAVVWESDLDGFLRTGNGTTTLSVGDHVISATVTDSGSLSTSATVNVVVEVDSVDSEITSPVPGSVLSGSTETFSWIDRRNDGDNDWISHWVYVGSSIGRNQYFSGGPQGAASSINVTGLPTDGSTVHVRLWWRKAGQSWQFVDYTYTAASEAGPTLSIQSPANGDVFSDSTVVSLTANAEDNEDGDLTDAVAWESDLDGFLRAGNGTTILSVGNHIISATVTDSDGLIASATVNVVVEGGSVESEITTPVPGSVLSGSTETFSWIDRRNDGGNDWISHWVYVGSSFGRNQYFNGGPQGAASSVTVTGLPTDGSTVYVRLWWRKAGQSWQFVDYTYTAATDIAASD